MTDIMGNKNLLLNWVKSADYWYKPLYTSKRWSNAYNINPHDNGPYWVNVPSFGNFILKVLTTGTNRTWEHLSSSMHFCFSRTAGHLKCLPLEEDLHRKDVDITKRIWQKMKMWLYWLILCCAIIEDSTKILCEDGRARFIGQSV